jgi:outer membrane receptor protein involved in Fe transport
MRGINTGGVASTVGVYTDDVPFGSSSGLANGAILAGNFDTFDLARVEVLRGPQGSLYGASSVGGALKYVMNQPTTAGYEARVLGTSENVDGGGTGYSLKGMVNVPISSQFALRPMASTGRMTALSTRSATTRSRALRIQRSASSTARASPTTSMTPNPLEGVSPGCTHRPRNSLLLAAQMQDLKSGAPNAIDTDPVTLKPLQSGEVQSSYYEQPVNQISDLQCHCRLGSRQYQSHVSDELLHFQAGIEPDATIASGLTGGPPLAALVTQLFGNDVTRPLSARLPQTTSTDKFSQELRLASPRSKTFEWLIGAFYTKEDSKIHQEIHAVEAASGEFASGIPERGGFAADHRSSLSSATPWHLTPQDLPWRAAKQEHQVASQVGDGPLAGGHVELTISSRLRVRSRTRSPDASRRLRIIDLHAWRPAWPGGPNVLPPNVPAGTH